MQSYCSAHNDIINISTKYFRTKAQIIQINHEAVSTLPLDTLQRTHALIVLLGESGLEALAADLVQREAENIEVKLVVLNRQPMLSQSTLEWALENGFEVVPVAENDSVSLNRSCGILSSEETCGLDRIIEALHSCVWPRVSMETDNQGVDVDEQVEEEKINSALAEMEALIEQAKEIRSLSLHGNASREERHRLAADTAEKMYRLLFNGEDLDLQEDEE